MKVNRVFCYSKEVALQNGNRIPIWQLVLTTVVFITAVVVTTALMSDAISVLMFETFAFMIVIVYYSIKLAFRLRTRMTGWATTDDNRIFKAMTVNNGQGLFIGGMAVGSMIDQLANNSNNLGRELGGSIGAAAQFYSMNRSAQYMSHPEVIAKMVEEAPNITGAEVIEILKVYNIKDNKHSIKINCDYKVLRKDKVKYKKNIKIEKSYNQISALMNIINTHI